MAKNNEKKNNNENKKSKCKCFGGGISFEQIGPGIGFGCIDLGAILASPDRDCGCAMSQKMFWEMDDKVSTREVFEDGETPVLLIKLPHHRKIETIFSLKKQLAESEADLIVWKKIVEDHITEEENKSLLEQLSKSSIRRLHNYARTAISAAKAGGRSGKKVIKEVTTLPIFIEVMAGKKTYKNEAFNDVIKEICEVAIKSDSVEIQKEIDRIIALLPDDLKNATEIPTSSIPLELLTEENIKKFVELFKTE